MGQTYQKESNPGTGRQPPSAGDTAAEPDSRSTTPSNRAHTSINPANEPLSASVRSNATRTPPHPHQSVHSRARDKNSLPPSAPVKDRSSRSPPTKQLENSRPVHAQSSERVRRVLFPPRTSQLKRKRALSSGEKSHNFERHRVETIQQGQGDADVFQSPTVGTAAWGAVGATHGSQSELGRNHDEEARQGTPFEDTRVTPDSQGDSDAEFTRPQEAHKVKGKGKKKGSSRK